MEYPPVFEAESYSITSPISENSFHQINDLSNISNSSNVSNSYYVTSPNAHMSNHHITSPPHIQAHLLPHHNQTHMFNNSYQTYNVPFQNHANVSFHHQNPSQHYQHIYQSRQAIAMTSPPSHYNNYSSSSNISVQHNPQNQNNQFLTPQKESFVDGYVSMKDCAILAVNASLNETRHPNPIRTTTSQTQQNGVTTSTTNCHPDYVQMRNPDNKEDYPEYINTSTLNN